MLVSCGGGKAGWKGSIDVIEGVTVIKNPIEPLYGIEAFIMEEDLSIGEAEGREEYMFQQISSIAVGPNEDIYVLDGKAKHVKVFDKQGNYIRTIGKPLDPHLFLLQAQEASGTR